MGLLCDVNKSCCSPFTESTVLEAYEQENFRCEAVVLLETGLLAQILVEFTYCHDTSALEPGWNASICAEGSFPFTLVADADVQRKLFVLPMLTSTPYNDLYFTMHWSSPGPETSVANALVRAFLLGLNCPDRHLRGDLKGKRYARDGKPYTKAEFKAWYNVKLEESCRPWSEASIVNPNAMRWRVALSTAGAGKTVTITACVSVVSKFAAPSADILRDATWVIDESHQLNFYQVAVVTATVDIYLSAV